MPDMTDEILANIIRHQTGGVEPEKVRPTAKADMSDEILARILPDMMTDKLTEVPGPKRKNNAEAPGYVLDTTGWDFPQSIVNGVMQGWLPEARAGMARLTGNPKSYEELLAERQGLRKEYEKQNPGKSLTGELLGSSASTLPLMAAGQEYMAAPLGAKIASTFPKIAPAINFLGGGTEGIGAIPSLATRGAIEGGTGSAIASHLTEKPLEQDVKTGSTIGAILNPVLGLLGRSIGSKISSTAAETARGLIDEGVNIRAGQIPGVNKITSVLDRWFSGGKNTKQAEDFSLALSSKAALGTPTKNIDQAWVAAHDKEYGRVVDKLETTYGIPQMEAGLVNDLSQARTLAATTLSDDGYKTVSKLIDHLEGNTLNGIPGTAYHDLVQKGGLIDKAAKSPVVGEFIRDNVKPALTSAWERALPPKEKELWDTAQKSYKVARTIDDSIGKEGASAGTFDPKALFAATEKHFGNTKNAADADLEMLARGGQFLTNDTTKHKPHWLSTPAVTGAAAGLGAGAAGGHVLTHGPAMLTQLMQDPAMYAPYVAAALGGLGGLKIANAGLGSARNTNYLLDIAQGVRSPMLRGNNPAIPLASLLYNSGSWPQGQ